MLKSKINIILIIALFFAGAVRSFAQTVPPKEHEGKLIAVLKSDASHKEKSDACRQLAIIGTKKAVAPLVALLGDEKLSHMARYGLEPIPDPAVDEAFRDALGKLKGRPLVGVIGSIGVRRDDKAVKPLIKMLQDSDAEVAQAAARALGNIANQPATRALQRVLRNAPAANQLAVCEGLFRCAEAHATKGRRDVAIEIYDQLRSAQAPHQVRGGALRGAILTRSPKDGVSLLRQHLRSDDYILFSAACQAALELPGTEVTGALTAELDKLTADNQILVVWTLGRRADPTALPALFALAKSGAKPVRIAAIKALAQIRGERGTAAGLQVLRESSSVLVELLEDGDRDISQTAQETLGALPCQAWYDHALKMLDSGQTGRQLIAIELIGRQRIMAAITIAKLLEVAHDAEPKVRQAAIKMVGELGGPAELPALLDLLTNLKVPQDLDAARQALSAVCAKAEDPQSCTGRLISALAKAQPAQKIVLLRVLSAIGGADALTVVREAVDNPDAKVHEAAIRALGAWKTADAAPVLLALAKSASNPNDRTLCLRGYLGLAARGDLPANQRLSMCRQAAGLVQRNDEKKLLLGALGTVNSPDALALIMPYLDDPATREEASTASVAIAEKLLKRREASKFASKLIEPLKKAAQVTANADLARRAKALLRQARNRAGRK